MPQTVPPRHLTVAELREELAVIEARIFRDQMDGGFTNPNDSERAGEIDALLAMEAK